MTKLETLQRMATKLIQEQKTCKYLELVIKEIGLTSAETRTRSFEGTNYLDLLKH